MQWILLVVGGLVGLLILLVLIGLFLPRAHRASSQIELPRPVPEVWAAVRDLSQVPTFWPDIKTSERQPDREGHEVWLQKMKNGFEIPLEIDEDRPPSRLVTRIALQGKAPFGGRWIYDIAETPGGARLTLTEDGWVDNPFFRVISKITGYHATLDGYLKALGRKMGSQAQPVHVEEENK